MKIRTVLFAVCGALAPAGGSALADDISVGVSVDAPGEPVGSVDVFYDRLSSDGAWVDDAQLGRVFVPEQAGYVPYRDGHWVYTDVGFVWVSAEPFAWATSHYGRWGYSQDVDRWVWVPDLTWGPAWVDWSETNGEFGWAPMLPAAYVARGISAPVASWSFCPAEHVLDVQVSHYYEPAARVAVLQRSAQRIGGTATVGGARVVVGPSAQRLAAAHVNVKPTKLDMTIAGRMSATDAKAAVAHAQQNHAAIEQRNQQRVQADPKLRAVESKSPASHAAPAKTENRTEPAKPQPARPETVKPEATKPQVTKPEPTKPQVTKPLVTKPELTKPEVTKPEVTKPEPTKPQVTKPEPAKPEATKPEPAKPEKKEPPR